MTAVSEEVSPLDVTDTSINENSGFEDKTEVKLARLISLLQQRAVSSKVMSCDLKFEVGFGSEGCRQHAGRVANIGGVFAMR